jgi:very-short-patch-repair endonuclease
VRGVDPASSGHVVSGRSAAVLHGLPTRRVPERPEITLPAAASAGIRRSAHVFTADLPALAITSWFGVPVGTVARTVVDLARHNRRDGIMAVDAALRDGLVVHKELFAALGDATGWPGVRQARQIVDLADPRAESPLESILRLAMHDNDFPKPELQVDIAGFRVDMLIRSARLIVEADGRGKYTDDELWREKKREMVLRSLGYRVERVLWSDVMTHWRHTDVRLRLALRSA